MTYNKTKWVDNETPLSAQNLNKIEDGIKGVYDGLEGHKEDYEIFKGDLSMLETTAKDSIPNIINELFTSLNNGIQSVSNGKTEIATAIVGVDPNLQANGSETFSALANLIRSIQTGKKWALFNGTAATIVGTNGEITVTGLQFRPSIVMASGDYPQNNWFTSFLIEGHWALHGYGNTFHQSGFMSFGASGTSTYNSILNNYIVRKYENNSITIKTQTVSVGFRWWILAIE